MVTSSTIAKLQRLDRHEVCAKGFSDSDYATDGIDRKLITGTITTIGGALTNCKSNKQKAVALSSAEAEMMAGSDETKNLLFTTNLVEEMVPKHAESQAILQIDNHGAIFLMQKEMVNVRALHRNVAGPS